MVVTVLAIVLLFVLTALVLQIGIASWNIRRANRYRQQRDIHQDQVNSMKKRMEHTGEKFQELDKYATDISWLLKFLHDRYDGFTDLDKEIAEGIKEGVSGEAVDKTNKRYTDLLRAVKILKVTVRASEKIENFMGSIASQIHSIMRDLDDDAESEGESDLNKDSEANPETPSEEKDNSQEDRAEKVQENL